MTATSEGEARRLLPPQPCFRCGVPPTVTEELPWGDHLLARVTVDGGWAQFQMCGRCVEAGLSDGRTLRFPGAGVLP